MRITLLQILFVLAVVAILIGLMSPSPSEATVQAAIRIRSAHNLRQIGRAAHAYAEAHEATLPPAILDDDGRPLLSWRVLLLPYLEQEELYRLFRLDEPWDSEHNQALQARMPAVYRHPAADTDLGAGSTFYQAFEGPGAFFDPARTNRDELVRVMCLETAKPVPWTKPVNLHYAASAPLPRLASFYKVATLESQQNGGFLALLTNGVTEYYPMPVDEFAFRRLIAGVPAGQDEPNP